MRDGIPAGLLAGTVSSALSWNAHRSLAAHQVSTFPDIVTALSIPALVGAALWLLAKSGRVRDGAELRRSGRHVVVSAALVFAAFSSGLAVVRWTGWGLGRGLLVFGISLVGALLLGTLGAALAGRLVRSKARAGERPLGLPR